MDDIFKFATLMPRVAAHTGRPDYLQEVDDIIELAELRDDILRRVEAVINQVWKVELTKISPFETVTTAIGIKCGLCV